MHRLCESRYNLVMHHVDACHMLSFHFPEVVPCAASHPGMCIIVLDNMSDVFHPPVPAPFSQLRGKAFSHQSRHYIHIFRAYFGGFFSGVIPQGRQSRQEVLSPFHPQHRLQLPAPGQSLILFSQSIVKRITRHIAKFRLIGKKACYNIPEILMITLIMFFIHLIQQHPHGIRINQIDIFLSASAFPGSKEYKKTIRTFRQIKIDKTVLILICEIQDSLSADSQCLTVRLRHSKDSQQISIRTCKVFHQDGTAAAGTVNIHMALRQIQLLFLRLSGIAAVGMSGGKFVIIQNPQPHLSLLCFGTDVVQVLPPARTAEIRMWSGFQTYLPDSALLYSVKLSANCFVVLPPHPQERKDMACALSTKQHL